MNRHLDELLKSEEKYLVTFGWSKCGWKTDNGFEVWSCPVSRRQFTQEAAVSAQKSRDGYTSSHFEIGQESSGLVKKKNLTEQILEGALSEVLGKSATGETTCDGSCEPMCAWCNQQADIAAANREME